MAAPIIEYLLLSNVCASIAATILTLVFIDITKNTDAMVNCLVFLLALAFVMLGREAAYAACFPLMAVQQPTIQSTKNRKWFIKNWKWFIKKTTHEWQPSWNLLENMTVEMAKSRLQELYFGQPGGRLVSLGTSSQLEDLVVILKLVTNQPSTDQVVNAFVKFTRSNASAEFINAVEEFLGPHPISDTELLLTCLECLRADNASCLQTPEISNNWGAGGFVATITGTLNQTYNCSRVDLLNNVQQLVNCANTPYRRERLLYLVKSGAQCMRPLDEALALLRELTPDALKLYRHSIGVKAWPVSLEPLLYAAERAMNLTTTPNEGIRDMGRLLHEMTLLDNDTWIKLRGKTPEADDLIKSLQSDIMHNFTMMVDNQCSRTDFDKQFRAIPGFRPGQIDEIIDGLLRNCSERQEEAPDCVRRLEYRELGKLNNLVFRQVDAKNLPARGKAIAIVEGPTQ